MPRVRCCCVPGAPVLGGASACPNPRPRGWWRSLSVSVWDEVVAGFGVWLRRFWADLSDVWVVALVLINTMRNGLARTASLLAGTAHTRAAMRIITAHLCDCVRWPGRMCRAQARTPSRAYRRLALLGGFDNLVPISLGEAPLAGHHVGIPSMLLPINLELTRVYHLSICSCP